MTAFAGDGVPCILVVENLESQRRLLLHALAGDGYATVSARSGSEALAVLDDDATSIDLVLVAVDMPWLDALRIHRTMRRRGATIPVVFASGVEAPELVRELAGDPLTRFLAKPWTVEEMLRVVRHTLVASLWGQEYV